MSSFRLPFHLRYVALVAAFSFLLALSWTLPYFASGTSLALCLALALLVTIPFACLVFAAMKANDKLLVHSSSPDVSRLTVGRFDLVRPLKGKTAFTTPLFIGMLLALLALWTFFLLTLYPGVSSVDSIDVMKMSLGMPFESPHFRYDSLNSHHPILYTFLSWCALRFGDMLGLKEIDQVACFAMIHALVLAICYSWVTAKLASMYRSKGLTLFAVLFFVCNPLVAIYSISIWKDIVFSAVFLVLEVRILEILTTMPLARNRIRDFVSFSLLLLACALLRSNGVIVIVCVAVGLVLVCLKRREILAPLAISCSSAIIIWALFTGPLCSALGVQSAHAVEGLSIPLQQVARVFQEDGNLSESEEEFLQQILPLDTWKDSYDAACPNPLKFSTDFSDEFLEEHKIGFMETWLSVGLKNPGAYLRAWIDQTRSFWNVGSGTWYLVEPGYSFSDDGWFCENRVNVVNATQLYTLTESVISMFSPLFNIAILAWLFLYGAMRFIVKKDWVKLVCVIPVLALWLCFLVAAPMNDFRYFFPVHISLPFLAALLFFSVPGQAQSTDSL